jgi:hypothetical protein
LANVRFAPIVLQNSKNGFQHFSAKGATERQSPNDVSSSALPKLPVIPSLVAVVTRMIIRSPRPYPRKFVFSDPKRVLQHYPPRAVIPEKSVFGPGTNVSAPCHTGQLQPNKFRLLEIGAKPAQSQQSNQSRCEADA